MRLVAVAIAALCVLGGCDKTTPAGATASTSAGTGTSEASSTERVKTLSTSSTASKQIHLPAAGLIFPALMVDLRADMDAEISRRGPEALMGSEEEQLRQVLALAVRPMMAWPVNPLNNQDGARRWASTVGAAIEVADDAGERIAAELPTRALADADEAKALVRCAFEKLDKGKLLKTFHDQAQKLVVLDLADTSAVRFTGTGWQVSIDGTGATMTRGGTVRFGGTSAALGGHSYAVALEQAGTLTMTRQAADGQARTTDRRAGTGAEAGVK